MPINALANFTRYMGALHPLHLLRKGGHTTGTIKPPKKKAKAKALRKIQRASRRKNRGKK